MRLFGILKTDLNIAVIFLLFSGQDGEVDVVFFVFKKQTMKGLHIFFPYIKVHE